MTRHAFISRRQHAFGAFDVFAEIRNCDSNSILVVRRLRALIQEQEDRQGLVASPGQRQR